MPEKHAGKVLAEYMQRIDAGETVDVDDICQAHPEIADELRSYVTGVAMVEDLLKSSAPSQSNADQETLKPEAAHDSDAAIIGQMFGRYKIERQLGEGAMGAVYLALDTQLDRRVALKIPKMGYGEKGEFLARFQWEAQAAARLNHAGICPVFDFGEQDGRPFISMAYIKGQPLSRYIGTTQVNQQWMVDVIREVADALQQAHQQGVVHRDLKAGNVLINQEMKPVVTDFGLARKVNQTDESRITHEGAIIGTPGYMSPEQVEGDSTKIGPATDIYALGVMLYELITGELPFRGSIHSILVQITRDEPRDPRKLNPDADPQLCDLAIKMMSKEIEQRPASMQEIVNRLTESQVDSSSQSDENERKKNERRQKLENRKHKVAQLIQRGQYAQAVIILEKMSGITNADAVGYANWARQELKRVQELPHKVREGIPALVETAQELFKKHDYGQAAEMLQEIPQEMRTSSVQELLNQVIDLQDEVDLLLTDLHECVKTKQCEGIEENIARLLQLKPHNRFARNLQETLQTYSVIPVSQREYRYDDDGNILALEPTVRRTLIASVIIGLLLFGIMTYTITFYLKSGNETLTVIIDDELFANVSQAVPEVNRNSSHNFNSNVQVSRTTPLQPIAEDPFAGKQLKDRWSKNFLKTTFLWIPPGKFRMGSVRDIPLDRHEQPVDVEISHGLWVQQMELTQSEWRKLVGLTPWMPFTDMQANDRNAATHMTWDEAVDFCQRLTDRDRRLGNIPNHWEYRLPSEAEWEYFCRAGTTSTYSFGDNIRDLNKYAWWKENTQDKGEGYAHPVGQLLLNPWGLHDVHGNVFEFCYDSFQEQLPGGRDPVVAEPPIAGKMARGGGWAYVGADALESGSRDHRFARNSRRNRVGMRLVLTPVSEISAVGFGRQKTRPVTPVGPPKVIDANDWHVLPKESADNWRFLNGTLTAVAGRGMSLAYFNDTFEEFELTMDVRCTDPANGGVYLRAPQPHATFKNVFEVHFGGGRDNFLPGTDHPSSGGIYLSDGDQPLEDPGGDRDWPHSFDCGADANAFRTNEWNQIKIRLVDQLLEVEVNGQTVFWRLLDDLIIAFPNFTDAIAERKGYIGLQAFIGTVQYRNIRIQPLRVD